MAGGDGVGVLGYDGCDRPRLRRGGDGGLLNTARNRGGVGGGICRKRRGQCDPAERQGGEFGFRGQEPSVDFPGGTAVGPGRLDVVKVGVLFGGGMSYGAAAEAQFVGFHDEAVVVPVGGCDHVFEQQRGSIRPTGVVHAPGAETVARVPCRQVQVRRAAGGVHHHVGIKGHTDPDGLAQPVGAGGGHGRRGDRKATGYDLRNLVDDVPALVRQSVVCEGSVNVAALLLDGSAVEGERICRDGDTVLVAVVRGYRVGEGERQVSRCS